MFPKFFGMGDITHIPYLAMERIQGRTLAEVAGKLPASPELVARLGGKIATGLIDLHRQQIIHLSAQACERAVAR